MGSCQGIDVARVYLYRKMKRNLLLVLVVIIALVLAYNSFKKIKDFKLSAQTVDDRAAYLETLKKQNEELKNELAYKESSQFAELEIRNKLGMAKPGETIVVVPKEETADLDQNESGSRVKANWEKWKEILFGV